jgi:hypothetical protein
MNTKCEYDERVKKANDRVKALNARFAEWYYVIPADVFNTINVKPEDLVEPESAAATPGAGGDSAAPPLNLPSAGSPSETPPQTDSPKTDAGAAATPPAEKSSPDPATTDTPKADAPKADDAPPPPTAEPATKP